MSNRGLLPTYASSFLLLPSTHKIVVQTRSLQENSEPSSAPYTHALLESLDLSGPSLLPSAKQSRESTQKRSRSLLQTRRHHAVPTHSCGRFISARPFVPRQTPEASPRQLRAVLGSNKPLTVLKKAFERGEGLLGVVAIPDHTSFCAGGPVVRLSARICCCLCGTRARDVETWGPPQFLAKNRQAFREQVLAKPCLGVETRLKYVPPKHPPATIDVTDSDRPGSLTTKRRWKGQERR